MSTGMRKVKLWSTATLAYVGLAAAIALGTVLLNGLPGGGDRAGLWQARLFQFSTMLLFSGALIQVITGPGLFQVYFSILLSMGNTRKRIIRTFFLSQGATALLISLLAGLAWGVGRCIGHNPPQNELFGMRLPWFLLVAFGIQFLGAAFGIAFGAVALRWKIVGVVILMVVSGVIGGVIGWWLVTASQPGTGLLPDRAGMEQLLPLVCAGMCAAGLMLDLCAAGFAHFLTRKMEARA